MQKFGVSKGYYKVAWDRIVKKYLSHTAFSMLWLTGEFHNSKLDLIEKDPD